MLLEVQQRLLALHAGKVEGTTWVQEAVWPRLLREAVVLRPHPLRVLSHMGKPHQCHAHALHPTLCGVMLDDGGGVPWFGWRLFQGQWYVHSTTIDGSMIIDSGPVTAPWIFWGIPWDVELYRLVYPEEEYLPPVLERNRSNLKTAKNMRHHSDRSSTNDPPVAPQHF